LQPNPDTLDDLLARTFHLDEPCLFPIHPILFHLFCQLYSITMSDDLRSSVTKLASDGSNWANYRDRMVWNINSRRWAEHLAGATLPQTYFAAGDINGQTPQQRWDSEEAAVMNMIAASVPDHVFNRIKSKTNTHEVWTAVKAIYQTRSKMITVDLGKKLQSAKMGDDDDARAHLTQLLDLREQLASMGKNYDSDEFASILLGSLPTSYEPTISAINAAADSTNNAVTPDQVIRLVSDEYDRRVIRLGKKNGPDEAFAANGQKQRDKKAVECFNCHKMGHYKSDCWAKGGGKEGQRPARRTDNDHSTNNRGNRNNRGVEQQQPTAVIATIAMRMQAQLTPQIQRPGLPLKKSKITSLTFQSFTPQNTLPPARCGDRVV
jgi:hypothetical protein